MILLIDNYDSFSYNLYQLVGSIDPDIKVIRNDAMTVTQIQALNPSSINNLLKHSSLLRYVLFTITKIRK